MQRYLRAATPSEDGGLQDDGERSPDLGGSIRVIERGDNIDEAADGLRTVTSGTVTYSTILSTSAAVAADEIPIRDDQPITGLGLPPSITDHGIRRGPHRSVGRIAATMGADLIAQLFAIAVVAGALHLWANEMDVRATALLTLGVTLGWVAVLGSTGGYKQTTLRNRGLELRHVLRGALYLGAIACIGFTTFISGVPPAAVLGTMAMVVLLTIGGRTVLRHVLSRTSRTTHSTRVVLLGSVTTVLETAARLSDSPAEDVRIVGLCIASSDRDDHLDSQPVEVPQGPPIVSDAELIRTVTANDADAVIITSPSALSATRVREIAWQLEETRAELMLSTGLEQVAEHRIGTQRLGAECFVTVDQPRFSGAGRAIVDILSRIAAALGLLLLSPFLLIIGLIVRIDSDGPALFIQTRVGRCGDTFRMVKFRSMVHDAETRRDDVAVVDGEPDRGPMFKSRNDPRITRIGRILRKSSVDELPQLINVVCGSMTLVGPRPALPGEVRKYTGAEFRRLLVKPGITGLWQVSGRSNLNWEQTVKLDLQYVENWTPGSDLSILSRTVGAVAHSAGAY